MRKFVGLLVFFAVVSSLAGHALEFNYKTLNYPEFLKLPKAKPNPELCLGEVKVAVIDTGIDYTDKSLAELLYWNSREKLDGKDNDGNGFADDVAGWDFVSDVNHPFDVHGHGTNMTGIIAGLGMQGYTRQFEPKVNGCVPNIKVIPLKYYDNSGLGYNNLANLVRAVHYAVKLKVNVINFSGGGNDPSVPEREAIEEAAKAGILVVAAAGNDGRNNDLVPCFPASYELGNIISVGSTDGNGKMLSSSNFGIKSVDLLAPGLNITSHLPGGKTGAMSGTSQSTAYVTRIIATIMSVHPRLSVSAVKKAVFESAVKEPRVKYGRADLNRALVYLRDQVLQKLSK
jgi:subtilisin family serine protease